MDTRFNVAVAQVAPAADTADAVATIARVAAEAAASDVALLLFREAFIGG
jgi:predicted amidohydrolase